MDKTFPNTTHPRTNPRAIACRGCRTNKGARHHPFVIMGDAWRVREEGIVAGEGVVCVEVVELATTEEDVATDG